MPTRFFEALRDRLGVRSVLSATALFAILYFIFDVSIEYFVQTGIAMAIVGLTDVAGDAYDLRESVQHGGIGLSAIAGSAAMLALGSESVGAPAIFLVVGSWFVLDAVQTARHEGATTEPSQRDGHEVYRTYVARRVHETLDERPLTRRELHDELDADDGTVDDAVEELRDRGVVECRGSELRVVPSRDGPTAASRLRTLARRIARPLTLELEDGRSARSSEDDGEYRITETSKRATTEENPERLEARR